MPLFRAETWQISIQKEKTINGSQKIKMSQIALKSQIEVLMFKNFRL
jgi:hypothetical protein